MASAPQPSRSPFPEVIAPVVRHRVALDPELLMLRDQVAAARRWARRALGWLNLAIAALLLTLQAIAGHAAMPAILAGSCAR